MKQRSSILVALLLASLILCTFGQLSDGGLRGATAASDSKLRTFFCFESGIWMETRDVSLELQPIRRHPDNPVIRRGEGDALDSHRVHVSSILPEGNRLRAWYGAIPAPQPGKSIDLHEDLNVGYAESEDGVHWTKPKLNLVRPGTNLIIEKAFYLTVMPEPDGKPGFRGAVGFFRPDVGRGGESGATFEFVRSADGYHWDFQKKPSTTVRHFESYGMFHRNGRWWLLGQGVPPYFDRPPGVARRVMYGFHTGGEKEMELYPRPLMSYPASPYFDDAAQQTHVGAGIWDRDRILLGISGHFWPGGFSATASYSIGLIYSYDGIGWTEPFAQTPILMPGTRGSWDAGWLMQVQRPVSKGDETYLYYVGGDRGNEWAAKSAVGLGILRRDGFAAYKPSGEKPELITVPIERLPGETDLYVNVKGSVTVQVLDRYLRPISEPVTTSADGVRTKVLDLQALRLPDKFRLSIKLAAGAQFFTFSLGPNESYLPSLREWR